MKQVSQYKANGYNFNLIKKGEKSSIFKGTNKHGSVSFEVHKIRIAEEATFVLAGNTINTPKRERIASNQEFGTYGFAYGSLVMAENKFLQIENK